MLKNFGDNRCNTNRSVITYIIYVTIIIFANMYRISFYTLLKIFPMH